jgi:hypothetical protein
MRIKFYRLLFAFGMFFSSCYGGSLDSERKDAAPSKENEALICMNSLKGFSEFVVFTEFPGTGKNVGKINKLIKDEFSDFGAVVSSSMLVKTLEGEAVDLSGFDVGAFLTYKINDLNSLDGKKLGMLKATLTLNAGAHIDKTNQDCSLEIWSQSCFLKGDSEKKLEESISRSLRHLLQIFWKDYSLVNGDKPTFNLYES